MEQDMREQFEKGWDNINDGDPVSELRKEMVWAFIQSLLTKQAGEQLKDINKL